MTADIRRAPFGVLPTGEGVEAITLRAGDLEACIITLGATLQAMRVPGEEGRLVDIVLGHDTPGGYLAQRHYLGATIGRFANRIAGGSFVLDGVRWRLDRNEGANTLHGGAEGFDRRLWRVTGAGARGASAAVCLELVSPDGDQGFPGDLTAQVTYRLGPRTGLSVVYRARTDRPTVVSLTNHAYWDLAGAGAAEGATGHRLTLPARTFLPVGSDLLPTGALSPVAGTPFDFRRPRPIGERLREADPQLRFGRGYDHCFVIAGAGGRDRLMARLEDPVSGRRLEMFGNATGLHLYSANGFDGSTVGKGGRLYRRGDGVCLEAQELSDTPNRPAFGSARLDPGRAYENRIRFRVSRAAPVDRAS